MSKSLSVERYYIPSTQLEGWAVIFIDSNGFFSTVSDYGNYGYVWTHPGVPFHEFLARLDEGYLIGKLSEGKREYNGERTAKAIKARIKDMAQHRRLSKEERKDEEALLNEHDQVSSEAYFALWQRDTSVDPYELAEYTYSAQLHAFYQKVWPRFVEQLKARHNTEWISTFMRTAPRHSQEQEDFEKTRAALRVAIDGINRQLVNREWEDLRWNINLLKFSDYHTTLLVGILTILFSNQAPELPYDDWFTQIQAVLTKRDPNSVDTLLGGLQP